ncbi:hypothetical protein GCM10010329_03490 [Streptomyces spiroverticillatus]|uniref:Uncharacterized protein n=1 Tax=Streptomyces finlayi TaxID=67296 RepID=A0A918WSW2_9ACTN|nr:hypothetical protein [Streptomyces finlayi]GGZ86911.1 hypothetical protein GCM10010329_03490 [Streptomyces spiroverticillatus]GHC78333.1 hypothetical protein GCM10010334_03470 [Streptomyces finlayi]
MATNRVLGYLESRKNLAGCGAGLAGLALTFTGAAGAYWPLVVAGLYGAGALVAPPERVEVPGFGEEGSALLREDFDRLRAYVTSVTPDLPPVPARKLAELVGLLDALLAHGGWDRDPESLHILGRAVREDVPEAVDTYLGARWWTKWTPGGGESPEKHVVRQLALILRDVRGVAEGLREVEGMRQESLTRYLEER